MCQLNHQHAATSGLSSPRRDLPWHPANVGQRAPRKSCVRTYQNRPSNAAKFGDSLLRPSQIPVAALEVLAKDNNLPKGVFIHQPS